MYLSINFITINLYQKSHNFICTLYKFQQLTCSFPVGQNNMRIKAPMTLAVNPTIVIVFGAMVLGTCSINHLQKTCIKGSQTELPSALYLCSFSLFSWLCESRSGVVTWLIRLWTNDDILDGLGGRFLVPNSVALVSVISTVFSDMSSIGLVSITMGTDVVCEFMAEVASATHGYHTMFLLRFF